MTGARLELTRSQILAFRQRVGALDDRLPRGRRSLRKAAWAGLQDSVPRAALHSIHARVGHTVPATWEDPSLAQVWGPRYCAFVVPSRDLAVFTLGRLPGAGRTRRVAEDLAERLHAHLDGRTMRYDEAGRALGVHPNSLRYAALTGTVAIRWEGARLPTISTVSPPEIDEHEARLELARRYLHVYGPARTEAFARWAGIGVRDAADAFRALGASLRSVRTPIGDACILTSDEPIFRAEPGPPAPARLLPSGDPYFLLWGADRKLLVPDRRSRDELWTSRVWPGALLVEGEIVGVWRRADEKMKIRAWRRLTRSAREAVEAEASSLPIPVAGPIVVRWGD